MHVRFGVNLHSNISFPTCVLYLVVDVLGFCTPRAPHACLLPSAMAQQKSCIEQVIDTAEANDPQIMDVSDPSDDEPPPEPPPDQPTSSASTSKKKKKKKSKATRALAALRPQDAIPQSLVDQVLEKVKAEHGEGAPGTDEAHVRMALEQLKVGDVIKGKAGIGGKNRKEMGEHKVCR